MGKSQKPLRIVTIGWAAPELSALREQGHSIVTLVPGAFIECDDPITWRAENELMSADLILGPTCWLMDEAHRKYLPLALAEARKRRYPTKEKE